MESKKLLNELDKPPNVLEKSKTCIELYDYIYKILKELYELQHIDNYKRLIEIILKKIPILTQNLIIQIKKVNKYENYYIECINKMAMVQQLANELKI